MYAWETKENFAKYGKKMISLRREQIAYEQKNANNPCDYCGAENKGSVVDVLGEPQLLHFGMWACDFDNDVQICTKCGNESPL